jgi:ABC-type branched-subunit amino acid transport system permease subunit
LLGEFTGGEDGIQGVARPTLPGFPVGWLSDSLHYYIFAATIVFVFSCLVYWLIESPFGSVLHAIRENKERARFLGYDVNKYRINAFVISTIFPAIAGWLWGIQTFFGPILGAIIYWELQNNISQATKFWEAWIGVVFAVFVIVGPRGIMGILDDIRHYGFAKAFNKKARQQAEIAEELPPLEEHAAGTTVIR